MKKEKKYFVIKISLIAILCLAFVLSFSVGRYSATDIKDVLAIFLYRVLGIGEQIWNMNSEVVVMQLRLPRILGAVMVGSALAMSGASYQALFGNPIASQDTLGVSNAASFGAVLGIILGVNSSVAKIMAFGIGCIAVFIVFFMSVKINKGRSLTVYLLLMGMIVSSIFSALLAVLKYVADPDNQLPQITYWLMGSMSKITLNDIKIYLIFWIVGIIPLFLLRWRMNLLSLSDTEAVALGENITVLRGVTIFSATLLTAASTAMTGGISWIGLIIPHIVRMLVGTDFRKVFPISGLLGASFLLIMDDLSRTLTINELPISIMTSLIGAPIFFAVLLTNKGGIKNER
jgi:ABC-type fe3+-siderophore transport system, permease component